MNGGGGAAASEKRRLIVSSPESSSSSGEPDDDEEDIISVSSDRAKEIEEEVKVALKQARKRIEQNNDVVVADNNEDNNNNNNNIDTSWSWIDHMKVNEWSISLLSLDLVQPSRKLHQNIREYKKDLLLPILNRMLLRLLQENLTDKPTRRAATSVEKDDMQVNIVGDITDDKKLCKAVVALYYHALEAVLYCETKRLDNNNDDTTTSDHYYQPIRIRKLISDSCFHRAMLACCVTCAAKAIGITHKLRGPTTSSNPGGVVIPVNSALRICECDPYDFLKVSDTFCRSLKPNSPACDKVGSPLIFPLPRILVQHIKQAEVHCLDSLLWKTARDDYREDPLDESLGLFDRIEQRRKKNKDFLEEKVPETFFWWPPEVLVGQGEEKEGNNSNGSGGGGSNKEESASAIRYPPREHKDYPEYAYISYILRKVLQLADTRIQALCRILNVPSTIIAHRAMICFTSLLRDHIDVLYDRHLDVWVFCCLYGASKTWNNSSSSENELTFARILEAFVQLRGPELGEITCQHIGRVIPLFGAIEPSGSNEAPFGDATQLYSKIFLPRMKDCLLKMASHKRGRDDEHTNNTDVVNIQVTVNAPNSHAKQKRERLDRQFLLGNQTQTVLRFGNAQSI